MLRTYWSTRSRWQRICLTVVGGSILSFLLLCLLFPLPIRKLEPAGSQVIVDRNGEMLRVFLAPDEMWRMRMEDEEISPYLKQAVLAYEDQYFFWHPGINPVSILRAAWINLKAGEVVQGGSTLTMQLARMMEPKARTLGSKLVEAFRALQIELYYSKKEILTLYLNMAPYGGNIVGVGAASHLYFDKYPDQLSQGEAALLAAIPNAPTLLRPDANRESARKARAKVLTLMRDRGYLSTERMQEAIAEPVPDRRYKLPFLAPHLATSLVSRFPNTDRLYTTIDLPIQLTAERLLRSHLDGFRGHGITNAAVVVIENASRDVLALVGSYDFFDEANQGQVNGALASRSPGSALKPFVYALGLEHGLVSPLSLIQDVPVDYRGYQPVNYDGSNQGAVTVEEALIRSLNVPAVNMYARLGERGLHSFLKEAGITTLPKDKDHYGLSLVLGSGEVNLLELTNLYAGLAEEGRFAPYHLTMHSPRSPGVQLLSAGTVFIISDILSQLRRPDLPAVWEWSVNTPKVAWKTGTSYGHRDAWSIGYTPQYTIGVWAGNFDGKGVPELVGADVSAPLLMALFEAFEQPAEQRWFAQPKSIRRRQVCAVSGMVPTPFCAATREEWYEPGHSPNQTCSIHRLIEIDEETGFRLCKHCRSGRTRQEKVFEFWPAEIATWKYQNGYPIDQIPAHYPTCSRVQAGEGPLIQSPVEGSEFKIRSGVDLAYQHILMEASASNRSSTLFWFLDRKLVHTGKPGERGFLTPEPGIHRLICMDDEGRSTEVTFTVHE